MSTTVTLINHATVLIRIDGVNILTDPLYSSSVGWIAPRMQKPGIPFQNLPPIDYILISHNDYDHLNMRTLRRLCRRNQSTVLVPRGDAKYARNAGFSSVVEMEWWQTHEDNRLRITCVPAKHKSRRNIFQRAKQHCCGYVIEQHGTALYFAGDTGYGGHFKEISSRHPIQAALLPIGAYKPYNWFREVHLNPETAVRAFLDLRADVLLPIHWGTFKISDEPLREPPVLLLEEAGRCGVEKKVRVLENGDSVELSPLSRNSTAM
ncbi:MAG: MBL fold metallo-hydrolase [Ignavibacteriae bacterium]|nr:MAG: MBL fold metallo-hydrolase [Ignavibacteriota bacterium]